MTGIGKIITKYSNSSLHQRVLTSVLLAPLIIIAIFALPILSFGIISALLILVAGIEWTKLIGKFTLFNILIYLCLLIIAMALSFFIIQVGYRTGIAAKIFYVFIIFMWLLAAVWVFQYNRTLTTLTQNSLYYGFWGIILLDGCWLSLNIIRGLQGGKWLVLYLLILIWTADIAAYFIGKRYGKHQLAKRVSPKKTWEGVYGAFAACLLMSIVVAGFMPVSTAQKLGFILLSILTVLFSIIGDLLISVFKRQRNLKDTGALLPGHGGILDRIDSLLAAAPIFVIGLLLLGLR